MAMRARLWIGLLFMPPFPALAQTAEQALARTRGLLVDPCKQSDADEIVICADRSASDTYRLPLEEPADLATGALRGEVPNASADRLNGNGCGIFEGQRRCGKAEMRRYGYGGGLDPLSFALKLGTILADPDADVAGSPPPRLRERR